MAYVITKTDFTEVETLATYESYGDALRKLESLFNVYNNGKLKRTGKIVGNYREGCFAWVFTDTGPAIKYRIEVAK